MVRSGEWYFAYGSNLKKERLKRRIGKWKQEQKAVLRGYKLTFAKGYYGHTSGKANIKTDSCSEVRGAIYRITENQFCELDKHEGVKIGVYERIPVNVQSEVKLIPATTYVMVKEICPLRPSIDYLNLILEGLREHGYYESTIREVKEK